MSEKSELLKKKDRLAKTALASAVVIVNITLFAICGLIWSLVKRNGTITLCFCAFFAVWLVIVVILCSAIAKKRQSLDLQISEKSNSVKRTGIWKNIWDDWREDGFEFNIANDKIIFDERDVDSIEFSFMYKQHELTLNVDSEAAFLTVDEETDNPREFEIELDSVKSLEQFYAKLNGIIKSL